MIRLVYHFSEPCDNSYDAFDEKSQQRIEIGVSRAFKSPDSCGCAFISPAQQEESVESLIVKSSCAVNEYFDCNIQQLKPDLFDYLYYALFFLDCIEIFGMSRAELLALDRYCDIQHRGNKGEGQFHITGGNITFHRAHFLKKRISYKELQDLFIVPAK